MWGSMAIAAANAISQEMAKRQLRAYENPPMLPYNQPEPKQAVTGKCPCCGSRQFVTHQSRRVCSYCRSEQDGQAVQSYTSPEAALMSLDELSKFLKEITGQYDMQYGYSALRPENIVRIETK